MTAAITYLGTAAPELTDSQIKAIFANLDVGFNDIMLNAFFHGKRNYTRKGFQSTNFGRNIHRSGSRHRVDCWSVLFIAFDVHIVDSIVHVSSFKE